MQSAADILDRVKGVLGEREKNYDNPKPNFQRIADYWNTLLGERLTAPITAGDVALMMILMKVAREQFKHTEDNFMDMIGYAVCGERIAESEGVDTTQIRQAIIALRVEGMEAVDTLIHALIDVRLGDVRPPQGDNSAGE